MEPERALRVIRRFLKNRVIPYLWWRVFEQDPYITCRGCGGNCYACDLEHWGYCDRSCMVRDELYR